jgi:hypothetical protein
MSGVCYILKVDDETVSARQANHNFSQVAFLRGARRGNPDLPLSAAAADTERQAAIDHTIEVMAQGLRDPGNFHAR